MLCLWTAKGGTGCTVTATALALLAAETWPTLLVDLGGDVPSVLGLNVATGEATPGVADWLTAERPPPDALSRLEVVVGPNIDLLPAGEGAEVVGGEGLTGADRAQRWEVLARLLAGDERCVIVDVGRLAPCHQPLVEFAERSLLVTRACYLALTAVSRSRRPDGVVAIREPGRALRTSDVEAAVGVSVVAALSIDPAVARAVDAGVFIRRLPRSLKPLKALVTADRVRVR